MGELADTVNEAVERAQEAGGAGRFNLNTIVAISAAITATFIAVCNVKDGNICQGMQQAQASAVDAWSNYQAKGTKLNIAESALDGLRIQRETMPGMTREGRALIDLKIGDYTDKIRRYELEKAEIKRTAQGFQEDYERLDSRHDQFDMAEALTSIAVALFGITALTQKKRLLTLAWAFAAIGVVLGLAGFFRLGLHPDFLVRALG